MGLMDGGKEVGLITRDRCEMSVVSISVLDDLSPWLCFDIIFGEPSLELF